MKGLLQILMFVFLVSVSPNIIAQNWTGIIDPSRASDWSNAGIAGGIPNRTAICSTLNPGASAAQINSAIANCAASQVVFLNAGIYYLSDDGIIFDNKNNVTLRGAGADRTRLVFTSGNPSVSCYGPDVDVCFRGGESIDRDTPPYTATWTAGYAKGTTQITLSNITGLAVGNYIILDQLDDTSDSGDIYVCATTACTGQGGTSFARTSRAQEEVPVVTAINGNTVTISPGLRMPNWRSSQSPGAWWSSSNIQNSGIENLTIDNTNGVTGSGNANIMFKSALNCWAKGIRSIDSPRDHIWLYIASHIVIQDSYLYGSQTSASQSYGIEMAIGSDLLVQNNITQHVTAPFVLNSASVGSVFSYNFSIDDNYDAGGSAPGWEQPMFVEHDAGTAMTLYEGNSGLGIQADNVHGTHHFSTFFRNHWYGDIWNNPVKNANTDVVHLWRDSRFFNVIGNVLGRTGYYTLYETNLTSNPLDIYSFGDPDNETLSTDPRVEITLMRWGNYDTVNAATRFLASEVPSTLTDFANPVPSNQSLPPSFYLNSQPGWFGSVSWPPVGPDVTGGDIPGYAGHAYQIPARLCYETTPTDSNGILIFSADTCYSQQNRPAPPSNVRATVN